MTKTLLTLLGIVSAALPCTVRAAEPPPADLQALIDAAIKSHAPTLTLPPGTYRLAGSEKNSGLLEFNTARHLTVEAKDVHLVSTNLKHGVKIVNCTDTVIRGFTLDYDPLPFTQGTVEEVNEAQGFIVVKLDEGYPETDAYQRCGICDRTTRKEKFDTSPAYNTKNTLLGQRRLRVEMQAQCFHNLAVGDLFVLGQEKGAVHAVLLTDSANVTLEDVAIQASPVFALYDNNARGVNTFRRVRVSPGPPPPGATAARLRSSVADGLHSGGGAKGPLIEDCLIEDNADDGIAIRGRYFPILEATPKGFIFATQGGADYKAGDQVEVVSSLSVPTGRGVVTAVRAADTFPTQKREAVMKEFIWEKLRPLYTHCWEVELQTPMKVAPGDRVTNLERGGNGYVIRHNTIRNNRARGMLVKASDGLIEDNVIDGSSRAGIALCPELNWMEAGYSHNVVIRRNTIRHAGHEAFLNDALQSGAISICCAVGNVFNDPDHKEFAPPGGHEHIVIEDNRFEDCRVTNLLVTSAADVSVRRNTFVGTCPAALEKPNGYGVDFSSVIWVTQTRGIVFADNHLVKPGPKTARFLTMTNTVTEATGVQAGGDLGR